MTLWKQRTFSGIPGDSKCECADKGCPAHQGSSDCRNVANTILYRIDMDDQTGTALCDDCANDATMSGLFVEGDDAFVESEEGNG